VASYKPFAEAAIDALGAGPHGGCPGIGGIPCGHDPELVLREDRYKYTPDRKGNRTKDAYDEFSVRQFIAFAPMWQAYQQFYAIAREAED
jgi:hypothetical protein